MKISNIESKQIQICNHRLSCKKIKRIQYNASRIKFRVSYNEYLLVSSISKLIIFFANDCSYRILFKNRCSWCQAILTESTSLKKAKRKISTLSMHEHDISGFIVDNKWERNHCFWRNWCLWIVKFENNLDLQMQEFSKSNNKLEGIDLIEPWIPAIQWTIICLMLTFENFLGLMSN